MTVLGPGLGAKRVAYLEPGRVTVSIDKGGLLFCVQAAEVVGSESLNS